MLQGDYLTFCNIFQYLSTFFNIFREFYCFRHFFDIFKVLTLLGYIFRYFSLFLVIFRYLDMFYYIVCNFYDVSTVVFSTFSCLLRKYWSFESVFWDFSISMQDSLHFYYFVIFSTFLVVEMVVSYISVENKISVAVPFNCVIKTKDKRGPRTHFPTSSAEMNRRPIFIIWFTRTYKRVAPLPSRSPSA